MKKTNYLKNPAPMTRIGFDVLRARLSYKETQSEFARRFKVSRATINKWETGKVTRMQKIYADLLVVLTNRLRAEGRLLDESHILVVFKEDRQVENAVS